MKKLQYHAKHRHATWLELFFDLVFVASIGVVTHNLAHTHHGHISVEQLLLFPVEFLPVWWIWATHMLYANRYDTDSSAHRVTSLTIMFFMITMSAFLGEGLFDHYEWFIGFYIAIRIIFAGLYFSSSSKLENSNSFARAVGIVIAIGAIISGLSFFFEHPFREILLINGIFFEMVAVVIISMKTQVDPIHREHFVERIGLFSILLLGESIISLLAGLRGIEWTQYNIIAAITGFLMIGSLWWIYFTGFHIMERLKSMKHGLSLLYSQIFLAMGLVILANIIRHTILQDLDIDDFRIIAIAGMISFYVGKQLIYFVSLPIWRVNIFINTVVCVIITVLSTFFPRPEYALIGITLGMFFYTYSNFKWVLTKDISAYLD